MYSGNRSGGQESWEGGGGAGAEARRAAGPLSAAALFSAGTYGRLALLAGAVGLLGAGGSLLALAVHCACPPLRTPTRLFLASASLSDLLGAVCGVAFTFVSCLRNGWVWGAAGCAWDGFGSSLCGSVKPKSKVRLQMAQRIPTQVNK